MSGPSDYDPEDFGGNGISHEENWRDSGYDHNHVYDTDTKSSVSWNEVEWTDDKDVDHRDVVDVHYWDKNKSD